MWGAFITSIWLTLIREYLWKRDREALRGSSINYQIGLIDQKEMERVHKIWRP
jgi:hypothetical protein